MNASHRTAASLTLFLALGLFACREDAPAQEGPATPAPKQGDLPTLGAAAPKIVVSLFTDYQCPNCRRAGDLAARLVDRWPDDVQVRFHHMPLEIHPLAVRAGTAAQAAHKQGAFLCVHTALTKTRNLWNELGESEFDRFALEVLVPRCALDPATFQRDLDDPATAAIVLAARERARDLGVPGTPSVYVNGLEADAWPRPATHPPSCSTRWCAASCATSPPGAAVSIDVTRPIGPAACSIVSSRIRATRSKHACSFTENDQATVERGAASVSGRNTENTAPRPIRLWTSMVPPRLSTMRWQMARPRPVPVCLVV